MQIFVNPFVHPSGPFCLVECGITVILVLMVTWRRRKWLVLALTRQSAVGGCGGLFRARCRLFFVCWKEKI